MVECPVCKRPDLANGLERCPQCNADLECFDLLETLQEQPAGQAPLSPQTTAVAEQPCEDKGSIRELPERPTPQAPVIRKTGPAMRLSVVLPLMVLMLTALMAFVGHHYLDERFDRLDGRLEDRLASADNRTTVSPMELTQLFSAVQDLKTRLETVDQRLSDLTAEQMKLSASLPPSALAPDPTPQPPEPSLANEPPATAAPTTVPPGFSDYHAAPSETLWEIARRFYGKGIYYPILLEDNPGLAIYGPPDRQTIRIARQPEHAQTTYRRLVHTEGADTLYSYRAKAGDSWRSLARAFYGSTLRATELAGLNGRPQPEPGQRVLIPLD